MAGFTKSTSYIFNILLILNYLTDRSACGHPHTYTSTPITITRYTEQKLNQTNAFQFTTSDEYFKIREQFVQEELQQYLGNDLELNENELKLNKILMKLKMDEFNEGFEKPYLFKASRHFFEVVDKINESKLFKLIEKMPKGAVLHAHDTAMASIDFIINTVLTDDKYYNILWYCDNTTTIITNSSELETMIEINKIRFLFAKQKPLKLNEFNDWRLLNDVRKEYDTKLFNEILNRHLTLYTKSPAIDFKDINDVWNKFANIFITLNDIVLYKPVWEDYFYRTLQEFYEDNVQYIEFRGLLPKLYDLDGTDYTQMDTLTTYNATLERFKLEHPDFIGAKFIYGPNRRVDNKTFTDYIKSVKEFKARFPKLIAGFDLVAQEDLGNPLKEYIPSLLELRNDNIEFFFHAGETNWNGMNTDENLIDAVLLGSKRIGHGYALTKHPKVMAEIKNRDIAIEVNPISNQVLKLVDDNRNHPCSHLFADNYPVVISSDDPSFWAAKPLSSDFYIAFMGLASAHADLKLLKTLAMNSLKYSTLQGDDLYQAQTLWNATWNYYVETMLQEDFREL